MNDVAWADNTAGGSHVFFTTVDAWWPPTTRPPPGLSDLYQRAGGVYALLALCNATDLAGNTASKTFIVHVTTVVDMLNARRR